jgi:hypothetical protein
MQCNDEECERQSADDRTRQEDQATVRAIHRFSKSPASGARTV